MSELLASLATDASSSLTRCPPRPRSLARRPRTTAPVEATPESAPPTAAQIEAWLWSHGWRVHTSHDDGSTWMTPLGNVVYVDRRDEKAPLRDYYLAKLALLHRATVAEITAEMLATETQKGGAA